MQKIKYIIFIGFWLISFGWSWGQENSLPNDSIDGLASGTINRVPVVRKVWFGMSIEEVIESERRQPLLAKVIENNINQKSIVYQEEVFGMTLLLYYLFVDSRLNSVMYYCILNCSQDNYAYIIEQMGVKYGLPNLLEGNDELQYSWQLINNQKSYLITAAYQIQNMVNLEEPNSFTIGYTDESTVNQFPLTN